MRACRLPREYSDLPSFHRRSMDSIDKQRWARISPVLDELLETTPEERLSRLESLRRTDAALADEVEALLEHERAIDASGFLEGTALPLPDEHALAGKAVGSYTLDRPLGQGGMGSVWLAHRSDGHYEGQAAIKFLNLALLGHGGAERFRREGSVLARLAHPNIARLVDAGVFAASQPYLVIEYVDGQPIDRWCAARRLDVEARLRLFADVLAAVAHAHGNLVLHRDLKPSNILVTPQGQVKLLDFGIAKLLEDESRDATALTQQAGRAFTPGYAAPELVHGEQLTTAADVYALGVVLYELLAGVHPFALGPADPAAARLRPAIDDSPPLASTAAHDEALRRRLRGDLDAILNVALKPKPSERYQTVAEFAADLQRHLDGLPVRAQPDRFTYRVAKFVRRYSAGVAASVFAALAILLGAGAALWQAREANLQRDRAIALSARSEAVSNFVAETLLDIAPADQPIRVSQLLESSLSTLMAETTEPEHAASILELVGSWHLGAGNTAKAKELLDRAAVLTRNSTDVGLRGTILCDSAWVASQQGRSAEARTLSADGIKLARIDPLALAKCLQRRAFIAQNEGDAGDSLSFALQAQAKLHDVPTPQPLMEAALLGDIAQAHHFAGREAEADRTYAQALARYVQLGRGETSVAANIRSNWGISNASAGDFQRALQLYDDALRIETTRFQGGEPSPALVANRAYTLTVLAHYPEAIDAYTQSIAIATRHGHTRGRMIALAQRGTAYVLMGDLDRAEQDLADAIKTAGPGFSLESPQALQLRFLKARIAGARGRYAEALEGVSGVIAFLDTRKEHTTGAVATALRVRGNLHLQFGQVELAAADGRRMLEIARSLQGGKPWSSHVGEALWILARAHAMAGDRASAKKEAAEAARHLTETLGADHPTTRAARSAAL